MLKKARVLDPEGDYRLVGDGDFSQLQQNTFDLVLSAFTFDNIPTMEKKVRILRGIKDLLREDGRVVNMVSSPEIYMYEWLIDWVWQITDNSYDDLNPEINNNGDIAWQGRDGSEYQILFYENDEDTISLVHLPLAEA